MAHFLFDHSQKNRKAHAAQFDKRTRRKMKQASRQDYGKLLSLMRTATANVNKHRRDNEYEADSMGLRLLSKTPYATTGSLSLLTVLERADELKNKELLDLKHSFHHSELPFDESWLAYEVDNRWYQEYKIPDSLRTHPECSLRREALATRGDLLQGASGTDFLQGEDKFKYFRALTEFEMIESYFQYRAYGLSLFWCLLLQQQYPDNAYLQARAAQSLYYLHLYQTEHNLEQVLILPDQRLEENYNRFLTFVNDLRLSQLAQIAYYYADVRGEMSGNDEEFLYGWVQCSSLMPEKGTHAKLKAFYLKKFPQGKYAEQIRTGLPYRPAPYPWEGLEKEETSKDKKRKK